MYGIKFIAALTQRGVTARTDKETLMNETIIDATSTEGETVTIPDEPSVFKRALSLHHKITDPTVAVVTGAATTTKNTWRRHKAFQLAKKALKEEMTQEGMQILTAQEQLDAAVKAAKEQEKAAKKAAEDRIRELEDQLKKVRKEATA